MRLDNLLAQEKISRKAMKHYWKLIQQDSRKLSDKCFYIPTFRMHLTNEEILETILFYSQELR